MEAIKKPLAKARLKVERARADHGWFDVAYRTFKRYGEDDASSYAAALTYYTFFSIFPMLLFAAAVLGYVTFGNETLQQQLIDSGLKSVPILRDALSPEGLETIMANKQNLAITGLVLALYSGSGAIVALGHALNKINHTSEEGSFVQKRLRSLMWLGILGAAAVASLALSAVAGFAPGPLAFLLALAGGLAVNTGIFATAFKFLTTKDETWSSVLPGAVVAAAGFEILKVAGTFYLARGETARNDTFGTFAAAAALLIASYLIAQVTLLSAEVNAVLAERRTARQSSGS
ncbi:MAG TPA: YihY/virulence factor BrkB family protein [Actinomycetota bacterium]|nr:YihY/virulence factor BrkB family protein [Actinomycetota bacterium]